MEATPESRLLQCPACGGGVTIAPHQAHLPCPFCGAALRVGDTLYLEVASRSVAAKDAIKKEMEARWRGTFYAAQKASMTPSVIGITLLSILLTGWFLLWMVHEVTLVVQLPALLLTVLVMEISVRAVNDAHTMPKMRELAAVRVMRCAACGAFTEAHGKEAVSHCAYCRSPQIAPSELAKELLEELGEKSAESQQREGAELEEAMAAGSRWVVPMVALSFLSVVVAFPLIGWVAWTQREVWPAHIAWGLLPMMAYGVFAIVRWARVLSDTADKRRQMEALIDERMKQPVAG